MSHPGSSGLPPPTPRGRTDIHCAPAHPPRRRLRPWGLCLGACMLAAALAGGCQSTPEIDHIPITGELIERSRTAPISTLELSGHIGVQLRKSYSAGFNYINNPQRLEFELISPLGSSLARVHSSGGSTVLQLGDRQFSSEQVPLMLRGLLGLEVPFEHLNDILLARVDTVLDTDELGLVRSGRMRGLDISYADYRIHNALLLPTDITITAGPSQVRIRVSEVHALH